MNIESLLTEKVIEAVKACYDAEVEADKIQLQATRKEFAGDLTVVVFPFTRFSKQSPEETGKTLGEYLKNQIDEVKDYNVVKGFLNIEISSALRLLSSATALCRISPVFSGSVVIADSMTDAISLFFIIES